MALLNYCITFAFANSTWQNRGQAPSEFMNNTKIRHKGIVDSVDGNVIRVSIMQTAACSQCKAARHCSASESKQKTVDVFHRPPTMPHVGDEVTVVASQQTGFNAVWLGFGVPFVLLVAVVWLMIHFTHHEPLSALVGIGSLIPYYILLYFLRDKLRQVFSFYIEE